MLSKTTLKRVSLMQLQTDNNAEQSFQSYYVRQKGANLIQGNNVIISNLIHPNFKAGLLELSEKVFCKPRFQTSFISTTKHIQLPVSASEFLSDKF